MLAASLLAGQPAGAAGGPPRVGPVVNVSVLAGNQAETTVAVNPANPSNIVVASNVQFGGKLFKAYSLDGGDSWNTDLIADGTDGLGLACCDPSLAFDSFGNLFLIYLDSKAHDVLAALSTDGGASFTFLGAVEDTKGKVAGSSTKGGAFVDQPTVTTGPGSVWVTYKLFAKKQLLRASGAAVTGPILNPDEVAFGPPQPIPGSKEGSFGDIVVGPAGEVMVTYQDNIPTEGPSNVFVNLDPDGLGPAGFGDPIFVTITNVGGFDYIPPQSNRSVDAETGLAWDRSAGTFNGRLYLVYTDETVNENDDTNIFVRTSTDAGETWSAAVRVNDDAGANSQFNPHIAVDQSTGVVAVSWHDARNDLGAGGVGDTNDIPNDDAMYFAAVSRDGGASFGTNLRVSDEASNAEASNNGVEYGDYTGMSFAGGAFYPAWADNSSSTGDNPDGELTTFDIYTARIQV